MIRTGHFLHDAPAGLPAEISETMLTGRSMRMERIVSHGQASPPDFWYDQEDHEWVMLLDGGATLRFEHEGLLQLTPGMYALIPAHVRHRVEWTAPDARSVWLAIFFRDG